MSVSKFKLLVKFDIYIFENSRLIENLLRFVRGGKWLLKRENDYKRGKEYKKLENQANSKK